MTPKAAGRKARKLYAQSSEIYDKAEAFVQEVAETMCPFRVGNIIRRRDCYNRIHYFCISRIAGRLTYKEDEVTWFIEAFRCTKTGEKRGRREKFDENSQFELVSVASHQ